MNEVEEILNEYYNNYDEDSRLIKDKAHQIEFITTTKYIEKYLEKGNKILEIGAGTGRYSIHYAQKGFEVYSVELINKNLEILKNKITKDMKINAIQGNAVDLNSIKDDTFDITLVLGPLYHLYDEFDIDKAIKEAVRVTKRKGKIFMAYLTDDSVVYSYGVRKGNLKRLKKICGDKWNIPKMREEIFATFKVDDFSKLMKKYEVKELETVATDGFAPNMADYINKMTDKEFEIFLDYHLKNCKRKDLIGYSSHVLEIVEKI